MAGSSNFKQFNPSALNQENDAAYNADSLRVGGYTVNAIVPSPLLNKFSYQGSTFIAAFAQALANKGLVLSDANLATLTSVLSNVMTQVDLNNTVIRTSISGSTSHAQAINPGVLLEAASYLDFFITAGDAYIIGFPGGGSFGPPTDLAHIVVTFPTLTSYVAREEVNGTTISGTCPNISSTTFGLSITKVAGGAFSAPVTANCLAYQ